MSFVKQSDVFKALVDAGMVSPQVRHLTFAGDGANRSPVPLNNETQKPMDWLKLDRESNADLLLSER